MSIAISVICALLVANIVVINRVYNALSDLWTSIGKISDAELEVLKLTASRLNMQADSLSQMMDSQIKIANLIVTLMEQSKGES